MTLSATDTGKDVPSQVAALCTVMGLLIGSMRLNGQLGPGGTEAIFEVARNAASDPAIFPFSRQTFLETLDALQVVSARVRPDLRPAPADRGVMQDNRPALDRARP